MSKTILVVAAHADDEALGCSGTLARHASRGDKIHIILLTDGVSARNPDQIDPSAIARRRNAANTALGLLSVSSSAYGRFPDNQLDTVPFLNVVKFIEGVAQKICPDVVYTHDLDDLNVDHRICHQAVLTAFRPIPGSSVRAIYGFEVCSSTEWFFSKPAFAPQRFVDISDFLETKRAVLTAYSEEMRPFPHARSIENVTALAKWRGATVGVDAAEAFSVIREVVS